MTKHLLKPYNTWCICCLLLIAPFVNAQQGPTPSISRSTVSNFNQNLKQVYPVGDITTSTVMAYDIIFQNITFDSVHNVQIYDTLSDLLDGASFDFIASTDPGVVVQHGANGVLQFTLSNIPLPSQYEDSLFSQGYVRFSIQPRAGLPLGTVIQNSATIILDSGRPIFTDTTVNTIAANAAVNTVALNAGGINIFPNPGSQQLFISTSGFTPKWITIYNLNGQTVSEQKYTQQLDISNLTNGIYFIEVKNENTVARSRFVKM